MMDIRIEEIEDGFLVTDNNGVFKRYFCSNVGKVKKEIVLIISSTVKKDTNETA